MTQMNRNNPILTRKALEAARTLSAFFMEQEVDDNLRLTANKLEKTVENMLIVSITKQTKITEFF